MKIITSYFKNMSIKKKVVTTLIGSSTFIITVFLLVNFFDTRNKIADIIIKNYKEIIVKQFEYIEYLTEQSIEKVEQIAQNKDVIKAAKQIHDKKIIDSNVSNSIKYYFRTTLDEQQEFEKITFIDKDGNILFSTYDNLKLTEDRNMLKKIIKTDDIAIYDTQILKNISYNLIYQPISYPVYRGFNEKEGITGYIIAYINMNILDDSLSRIDLGEGGEAFLLDSTGRVICSSDEYEFKVNKGEFLDYYINYQTQSSSEGYKIINPNTGKLVYSVRECLRTDRAGFGIYPSHKGEDVIGVWKWFSYFKWILLIEMDTTEAFTPIYKTIILYIIIAILFIFGTVFISFILSGSISKSISTFMTTFSKGASGDLTTRYPLPEPEFFKIEMYKSADQDKDTIIDYDKSKGLCFFEIGTLAEIIGQDVLCKLIIENKYDSCTECKIYKSTVNNEMDEAGALFNTFMSKTKGVIDMILNMTNMLFSSSKELSSTTSVFMDNASSQAASAEEIMATIEELSAGFDNIAKGTEDQHNSLEKMIDRVNDLSQLISEMEKQVEKTQVSTTDFSSKAITGKNALQTMNQSMTKVEQSSTEMINIINIINDISEGTHLLSLNANIEAARAGVHGRGFAIVAKEISKLYDKTAASLKEIDTLIEINKDEMNKGISNVNNTVSTISDIIAGFKSINSMMSNIVSYIKKQVDTNVTVNDEMSNVKSKSEEILQATIEQKNASDEIVKSMSQITELSQEYASKAEKLSLEAEKFETLAHLLDKSTMFFRK